MRTIGVRVQRTSGFIPRYEQTTLGACVGIGIVAGSGGGDRGWVSTSPIACPDGAREIANDGAPVQEVTIDLEARFDRVGAPPPKRSVCLSGEECTEGGG